ncbi:MAG: glycosyltransferase [Aestuariivirga sp.]
MTLMAEDMPEVFGTTTGLHILLPTWNLEEDRATQIQASVESARRKMPGHHFLVISNSEFETYLLGNTTVPALNSNQSIFVNDQVWKPVDTRFEHLGQFDAVMNARFDKDKRHDLAAEVDRLLLIYGYSLSQPVEASTKRMKSVLPNAFYSNHELRGKLYSSLSSAEVIQLYTHADVGLCLSPQEGYSRASIEYMMCGLPVVSTESFGGRDRYYANKYCRIVEGNATAVAEAVQELRRCHFSRSEIRENVLRVLEFERNNFLRAINRVVDSHFRIEGFFASIVPFLGIKQEFISHNEILKQLKEQEAQRPIHSASKREKPRDYQADILVADCSTPASDLEQSGVSLAGRHPTSTIAGPLKAIGSAIDDWKLAGLRPKVFLRDDDAVKDSASLDQLFKLCENHSIPILLSAIPALCESSFGPAVRKAAHVTVAVHGYTHRNHAPPGRPHCELCADRPLPTIIDELRSGRDKLMDICDGRISELLVPPWNLIGDQVAEASLELGFKGISAHGWGRMTEGLPRINTHVDPIIWSKARTFRTLDDIFQQVAHQLDTARRLGFSFIGIVSHHQEYTDEGWCAFKNFLQVMSEQDIEWVEADSLLHSARI